MLSKYFKIYVLGIECVCVNGCMLKKYIFQVENLTMRPVLGIL